MKNGAHSNLKRNQMETHCLFLQVQSSFFFVIDDACVLKILKHTMTDEDDVISTRIQASIDFPVNKKNTIKFREFVISLHVATKKGPSFSSVFFLLIT